MGPRANLLGSGGGPVFVIVQWRKFEAALDRDVVDRRELREVEGPEHHELDRKGGRPSRFDELQLIAIMTGGMR